MSPDARQIEAHDFTVLVRVGPVLPGEGTALAMRLAEALELRKEPAMVCDGVRWDESRSQVLISIALRQVELPTDLTVEAYGEAVHQPALDMTREALLNVLGESSGLQVKVVRASLLVPASEIERLPLPLRDATSVSREWFRAIVEVRGVAPDRLAETMRDVDSSLRGRHDVRRAEVFSLPDGAGLAVSLELEGSGANDTGDHALEVVESSVVLAAGDIDLTMRFADLGPVSSRSPN